MKKFETVSLIVIIIALALSGCTGTPLQNNPGNESSSEGEAPDNPQVTLTNTVQPTIKPTNTPTITPSPAPTSTPTPVICNPGVSINDPGGDVQAPHADITGIETRLENFELTVTFHLDDLPDEITVRRNGIPKGVTEYEWSIDIDVDNNQETGFFRTDANSIETADYKLWMWHYNQAEGEAITGPFEDVIGPGIATVMKYNEKGMTQVSRASYEADTAANTITIRGIIPGITQDSKLIFSAKDYQFGKSLEYDRVCEIPTKPVEISYIEDFEDGNAQDWRLGSGWKIITEDGNHIMHGAGPEKYPYAWYSQNITRGWTDYAYQSKIRLVEGSIFVCLRSNQKGFYNVMLSPSDSWIVFADNQNELGYNTFGGVSHKLELGKWYLVRFEAEGENLRLFIDDQLIDEQKRSSHYNGSIGYYLDTGAQVDIDDIEVWSIAKQ